MKITTIALFLLLVASCHFTPEPSAEEVGAITHRLKNGEQPGFVGPDTQSVERWKSIGRFYESRGYRHIWVVRGHPQPAVDVLKQTLSQAPLHGLNPEKYDTAPSPDPIEHELRLSWALIQFAFDVAGKDAAVEKILAEAIDDDTLISVSDQLAPKHSQYQGLQRALHSYRESGSPAAQIHTIESNMERLRQLPSDLGKRHILVNVPEYKLTVVEDGKEILTMGVVVGKVETRTPIFSAEMTHVVFSPYWNIPESILTNETLPRVFKDQNYLARQNIEIVRRASGKLEIVEPSEIDWPDVTARSGYHFRQRPGAGNSLGLVKFLLPNRFNVYLHDTPADNLFKMAERDFSHGCIRLERPLELATYVLRDQPQWPEDKIKAAMHSGDETTAKLEEPLPVHIVYLTAWAAPDGTVQFLKDVYHLDGRLDEAAGA